MACDLAADDVMSRFEKYVKRFDFSDYAPFYHGTTKDRAETILKEGLLTRSDNPSLASSGKWGKSAESLPDRVYFSACTETMSIGKISCVRGSFDPHGTMSMDERCAFFDLVNYKKYVKHFILDEDSKFVPDVIRRVFSDWNYDACKMEMTQLKRMDWRMVKFFELGFVVGGGDLAARMIEKAPSAIFSITDWGTIAVSRSIRPEDLKVVPYAVYEGREKCRNRVEAECAKFLDEPAYEDFIRTHDAKSAEVFKERMARGLKRVGMI